MKKSILAYVIAALVIGLVGGYAISQVKWQKSIDSQVMAGSGLGQGLGNRSGRQLNEKNCLADDCLAVNNLNYPVGTLSETAKTALGKAIDDEYKAYSAYSKIIGILGMQRPFSMIIRAEETHISSLRALFDKYGLPIPENKSENIPVTVASMQQACQLGVDAEIANAKLYRDELLPAVKDHEDIAAVFMNLMNASQEKHLVAFEKCN